MNCNTCGTDKAARIQVVVTKEGKLVEHCDICTHLPAFWMPDVYLGGPGGHEQTDENLCGDNGQPIPFSTKREKATIMKMLGVRQADSAEQQHGSRNESHLNLGKKYFI